MQAVISSETPLIRAIFSWGLFRFGFFYEKHAENTAEIIGAQMEKLPPARLAPSFEALTSPKCPFFAHLWVASQFSFAYGIQFSKQCSVKTIIRDNNVRVKCL